MKNKQIDEFVSATSTSNIFSDFTSKMCQKKIKEKNVYFYLTIPDEQSKAYMVLDHWDNGTVDSNPT
jgi:hypothetical protein